MLPWLLILLLLVKKIRLLHVALQFYKDQDVSMEEIPKDNVEIKAVSQNLIYYDIPKNIRSRVLGGKFKGQAQKYFLLKLISGDVDLNIENTPEFDKHSWVPFWYPLNQVVDFKKELIGNSFVINNPKASSSCGCGLSFSV